MNSNQNASAVEKASEYAIKIGELLKRGILKVDWHHVLKNIPNTQQKYKYHVPGAGHVTASPETLRLIYNGLLLCKLVIERHLRDVKIVDYSHSHGHMVFILFELIKSCALQVSTVYTLGDGRDASYINATVVDWDLLKVRYITVNSVAPDDAVYICEGTHGGKRHKHGIIMV